MHILPNPPPGDDSDAPPPRHKYKNAQEAARIYFLPNLFTAGNLFFGFVAIIRCIQAKYVASSPLEANGLYTEGVWCILFAAFCDALDGRLARLGGRESLFGMEFDSIADTVSFGVAPALMVYFLILADPPSASAPIIFSDIFQQIGWIIGFIYLLCVAVRLARFNVITNPLLPGVSANASTKDFMGLPSPAAAGFVASLVLAMLHLDFEKQTIQQFTMLLPPLLLLVALLMISNIPYPSFKHIDWQTQTKVRPFIFVIIAITVAYRLRFYSPAVFFLCYIFYGLFRDWRRTARRKQQPPPRPIPMNQMPRKPFEFAHNFAHNLSGRAISPGSPRSAQCSSRAALLQLPDSPCFLQLSRYSPYIIKIYLIHSLSLSSVYQWFILANNTVSFFPNCHEV